MPINNTAFSDGDPLLASVINTELTKIRTWVNTGAVAGDIDAATVQASHVYRPDVSGYPKDNVETVVQQMAGQVFAVSEPGLQNGRATITQMRARDSIFITALREENDSFVIPHLSRRLTITSTADVNIDADMHVTWVFDETAGSPPAYPDTFGAITVVYQEVGNSLVTTLTQSRRRLTVGRTHNVVTAAAIEDLSPGVYDFWVEYRRNSASTDIIQVVVDVRSINVEIQE